MQEDPADSELGESYSLLNMSISMAGNSGIENVYSIKSWI
jgi:hypothetical protein